MDKEGTEMDESKRQMDELCRTLNIDAETSASAWSTFAKVRARCPLKGDARHWMACSLYIACRTVVMPTVQGTFACGNGVIISHVARAVGLSLLEFFKKLQSWRSIAPGDSSSHEVGRHIQLLSDNFHLVLNISRKYSDLLGKLIRLEEKEHPRSSSEQPCTATEVKRFCWLLFLHAKTSLGGVSDNLVNSYHLLLCVIDTLLLSVFAAERDNLIKNEFHQLLKGSANDLQVDVSSESLVNVLCRQFNGNIAEAERIRDRWWRPHLDRLIGQNVLLCGKSRSDFMSVSVFCLNNKRLSSEYEQVILLSGAPDERELLGGVTSNISTPFKLHRAMTLPTAGRLLPRNLASVFDEVTCSPRSITMATTPTKPADTTVQNQYTPVSDALHNLDAVKAIIKEAQAIPSGALLSLFDKHGCSSFTERVIQRVQASADLFSEEFTQSSSNEDVSVSDEASSIQQMAVRLYYKLLHTLLEAEEIRAGSRFNLEHLLKKDVFHNSLIACCLHIVLIAKTPSKRQFPWILEVLGVSAYDFVKIIETIIRDEKWLTDSLVHHLKLTEEVILDSLSWKNGSPLFNALQQAGRVFRYEEVALPNSTESPPAMSSVLFSPGGTSSVCMRRTVRRETQRSLFTNPAEEATTCSEATADLLVDVARGLLASEGAGVAAAGKTLVGSSGRTPIGSSTTSPAKGLQSCEPTTPIKEKLPDKAASPYRNPGSSLGIFLRKVYHLVSLRLKEISSRLNLSSDIEQKVWTCFEHFLVTHTEYFKDRHVDQFLLCSVYAVCKAHQLQVSFFDIMAIYKHLPHSTSQTYHLVCLQVPLPLNSCHGDGITLSPQQLTHKQALSIVTTPDTTPGDSGDKMDTTPSHPGTTMPVARQQKLGDIIEFYNSVFIVLLENFVLRLADRGQSSQLHLSPMPSLMGLLRRRQKTTTYHQISLTPQKRRHAGDSPRPLQSFCLQPLHPQVFDSRCSQISCQHEGSCTPSKQACFQLNGSSNATPTKPSPDLCESRSPSRPLKKQRSETEERIHRLAEKRWKQHREARSED